MQTPMKNDHGLANISQADPMFVYLKAKHRCNLRYVKEIFFVKDGSHSLRFAYIGRIGVTQDKCDQICAQKNCT